jgi:hypothetical protein
LLKLLLLLSAAFWGDTQVREWGEIQAHYGLGVPVCTRLQLVEFTLGISHIGIGASIVESHGFAANEDLIGAILPLHIKIPLYQRIGFWKGDAFFRESISIRMFGASWGQRFEALGPLGYLSGARWEEKAPFFGIEMSGQWSPIRMMAVRANLGFLFVGNAPDRFYLTLGVSAGTSGPISPNKIGPRLEIAGIVFEDAATGNSNGFLEPNEQGQLLVLLLNGGLKDSDTVYLRTVMRDSQLTEYLDQSEVVVPPVPANSSTEVAIPLKAGSRLPAIPLRIRIWGKDIGGNVVKPGSIDVPTVGS